MNFLIIQDSHEKHNFKIPTHASRLFPSIFCTRLFILRYILSIASGMNPCKERDKGRSRALAMCLHVLLSVPSYFPLVPMRTSLKLQTQSAYGKTHLEDNGCFEYFFFILVKVKLLEHSVPEHLRTGVGPENQIRKFAFLKFSYQVSLLVPALGMVDFSLAVGSEKG